MDRLTNYICKMIVREKIKKEGKLIKSRLVAQGFKEEYDDSVITHMK